LGICKGLRVEDATARTRLSERGPLSQIMDDREHLRGTWN
jgi:hypothetical protein